MAGSERVHDRVILDALEGMDPVPFSDSVWRVTRAGREPVRGSAANGRWSPGGVVEVLYTSLERDGALAEIGFRLSLEPVWPSRLQHEIHEIRVRAQKVLHFVDVASFAAFGVDVSRYESFDYGATQALAAAAHFLEFDGLLAPSARHKSTNLMIFMDRDGATSLETLSTQTVDWSAWRSRRCLPTGRCSRPNFSMLFNSADRRRGARGRDRAQATRLATARPTAVQRSLSWGRLQTFPSGC
jgi:hypothetical protein